MHKYSVVASEPLTATTQLLTLKNAEGSTLGFSPGQYAAISFYHRSQPTPARCFSIVSSPLELQLQFSIRIKGRFTRAVRLLNPGDEVDVLGPYGEFTLDPDSDNDVYLLAGGIGITPFMSMLRYASHVESSRKITLVYSSQNQDDVAFADELMKLTKDKPNLRAVFVISDGPTERFTGQEVIKGRLSPYQLDDIVRNSYENSSFYLCGPPGFMLAMKGSLHVRNVPDKSIVTEAFARASNRLTKGIQWPFHVYALTALSIVAGSAIVAVRDIVRTNPTLALAKSSSKDGDNAGFRQEQINQTLSSLPPPSFVPVEEIQAPTTVSTSNAPTTTTKTTQKAPAAATVTPPAACTKPSGCP